MIAIKCYLRLHNNDIIKNWYDSCNCMFRFITWSWSLRAEYISIELFCQNNPFFLIKTETFGLSCHYNKEA